MTDAEALYACEWCGDPLTALDGVWTHPLSGDYCPEGLAVGPTGTSPHLPALAADPARPGLDVEEALALVYAKGYAKSAPLAVAEVCDETLDRSGGLLGRVRIAARLTEDRS